MVGVVTLAAPDPDELVLRLRGGMRALEILVPAMQALSKDLKRRQN